MKKVEGIWLPDEDKHFAMHLERGPKHGDVGTYQYAKLTEAMKYIPTDRRRTALDIGAHVGLWSRVLADMFKTVIAFEPVHRNNECFVKNVRADNVSLTTYALGEYSGTATMTNDNAANSGNWRIDPKGITNVISVRLDEFSLDDVDFIKIDVEGQELSVINGGKNTILHNKPFMVIEQKPNNAERYGVAQTQAVDTLNSWGAKVIWIKSGDYFMGW
jgi:FkbM family methyltransferase